MSYPGQKLTDTQTICNNELISDVITRKDFNTVHIFDTGSLMPCVHYWTVHRTASWRWTISTSAYV